MTSVQVVSFDFAEATDDEWERFLKVHQAISSEINPDDPLVESSVLRKSIEAMSRDPHNNFRRYLAVHAKGMVGYISLNFPVEQRNHVAEINIAVMPDFRRQGIGRLLLDKAMLECQPRQITLLQGESKTTSGNAFMESFGSTVGNLVQENRLQMAQVAWDQVENWIADGKQRNPHSVIETFEGLISDDDAEISKHARLYTEIANQQPFADLEGTEQEFTIENLRFEDEEHRRIGVTLLTKAIRETDGSLSGFTEISYHPAWGQRVIQGLTGVVEQQRGRGLGKWLKADMLLHIHQHFPDAKVVITTNANTNAPMRSINDRLGFKFYQQRTMYKLKIADVP